MANKTKRMDQIKEIMKAHDLGKGIRAISRQLGVSKNTVRKYIKRCKEAKVPMSTLLEMSDKDLRLLLHPGMTNVETSRVVVFESKINYWLSELLRVGVTRHLLWEEYRSEHPKGFGYSQFCDRLSRCIASRKLTMHLDHRPGHQMMLDYAGKKLYWIDIETAEVHEVEVLVAVLPFSQYAFVIALASQKILDFIHGINQALLFYGGCPEVILSDNLRSFVKRANKYEPKFTDLCEQLAAHYQMDLSAARSRRPKDKASVENMVSTVYNRIYGPLRNEIFHSPEALNEAILEKLEALNNKHFQKKPGSRKSMFEEYEQPLLNALPTDIFEMRKSIMATVTKNYHVELGEDRKFYSVHYKHVGKRVEVIYTNTQVEIYDQGTRIAVHKKLPVHSHKKYETTSEHMPSSHQIYEELRGHTGAEFTALAKNIGKMTEWAIRRVLRSKIHEEQTYRSCMGILRLADKYSYERLESAAKRCYTVDKVSYYMLKRILDKNLDQAAPSVFTTSSPDHDNLRGPSTYK